METYNETPTPILPAPGEEEIWKPHPVYIAYEISTFGNVRRARDYRMLTPSINARGYATVHLRIGIENESGKYLRVHNLVADTFLEPGREDQLEIDHIDRNRTNNYYKNLRRVSHKENAENRKKTHRQGVYMDRPALVLLNRDTHELIREFQNLREVVDTCNISPAGVRDNIHHVKPPYTFGYFMIKDEYLEQIKLDKREKI